MKKLMIIILSMLTVIVVAGCSHEKEPEKTKGEKRLEAMVGTYHMTGIIVDGNDITKSYLKMAEDGSYRIWLEITSDSMLVLHTDRSGTDTLSGQFRLDTENMVFLKADGTPDKTAEIKFEDGKVTITAGNTVEVFEKDR